MCVGQVCLAPSQIVIHEHGPAIAADCCVESQMKKGGRSIAKRRLFGWEVDEDLRVVAAASKQPPCRKKKVVVVDVGREVGLLMSN